MWDNDLAMTEGETVANLVWREGWAWAASRVVGEPDLTPRGPTHSPQRQTEFLGHFRLKSQALKATEPSGHVIRVERHKAGGYPIQGWNWPRFNFTVVCSCGYERKNLSGDTKGLVQSHLEDALS